MKNLEKSSNKIDLVMWTLNGEATLPFCLKSIENTMSTEYVGQKIIIDGGSVDDTEKICMGYGWNVINAKKRGIPFQANQALNSVKSDFFASFEQDIVLHHDWFKSIMKHFKNNKVAVAQGVRVAINPVLGAIDLYKLWYQKGYSSLDNTVYRTSVIRELGGFNNKCVFGLDRELQTRVRLSGKVWVIDKGIVNQHLHSNLWKELKYEYKVASLTDLGSKTINLKRLVFSPIRGLEIAFSQKRPETVFYYPLLRLAKLGGTIN